MRTPLPPDANMNAGARDMDPPTDLQIMIHTAWLLAGVAIALAACTAADEAQLHQVPPEQNVAHLAPQANATSGNVDDMTY